MNMKITKFLVAIIFLIGITTNAISLEDREINNLTNEIEKNHNSIIFDNPEKWDWRDVDGVDWTTPVRDQLQDQCGSCWAFGATSGLESCVKIWADNPNLNVDLSEQYVLSCSPGDCGGWYLSMTLNWIKRNGILSEECFPYEADDTIPCEAKCEDWQDSLFGITEYKKVKSNISEIQNALLQYGPLPASMIVYEDFYPDFDGGVYQYEYGEIVFGHCVAIVGYDDTWGDEDEGYWICKNSWGTEWGEDGWFRIAYGQCNMETGVYYITGPNYPPLKPESPVGPDSGSTDETYNFSFTGIDPESDNISFMIDWGDGEITNWIGTYYSGEAITIDHNWLTKGDFDIRVKLKDKLGLQSDWSNPLTITMPKSNINLFKAIIQKIIVSFPILEKIIMLNNII